MNRVTCISGLKHEGATTGLVDEFKSLLEIINTSEIMSFKTHFIICDPTDVIFNTIADDFIRHYDIDRKALGSNSCIRVASSEEELMDLLNTFVIMSDCKVFIDNPDNIINGFTSSIFESVVDRYPNDRCGNSIDITYTRLRNISKHGHTLVEYIDYNYTGMSLDDIERYLNRNKIPYTIRVEIDDEDDIEYIIMVDDIPDKISFIKDLNIQGNMDTVDKFVIYNK